MSTLLVITVFIPLIVSLGLLVAPRLDDRTARRIALGTGLVTLAGSLILLAAFRSGVAGPQFAEVDASGEFGLSWFAQDKSKDSLVPGGPANVSSAGRFASNPNIRFALGLDGLSLWMFFLTTILTITAMFASWVTINERVAAHYGFMLMLEASLLVLFASLDVVLFLIAFEFTLVPLFFLIGIWGGPERRRAAVTFFFVHAGRQLADVARRDRTRCDSVSALLGPTADLLDT